MTTLYNMHTEGSQYRCTKFDSLGNVESTYLCTATECECPAGHAPVCRHRNMLPKFLAREAVNSFWFYDYDRGGWVASEPGVAMKPVVLEGPPISQEPDARAEDWSRHAAEIEQIATMAEPAPPKPWRRL